MRQGFDVFVDSPKIFFLRLTDCVTIAGAHHIDENEIGFVEKALAVVDEFIGSGAGVNVPSTVQARRGPKAPMCSHMVAEPGPPL